MKRLMLISLLSCLVVGLVKAAHVRPNVNQVAARAEGDRNFKAYLQGLGATCLGGAIGWGLGECFGTPKRGFQLGLIVPALAAGAMAYKKTQERDAITNSFVDDILSNHLTAPTAANPADMSASYITVGPNLAVAAAERTASRFQAVGAGMAAAFGLIAGYFFSK